MKHQKTLSAVLEYIAKFNPKEFSSPSDFTPSKLLTSAQRADIQELKARLKRKRLLSESLPDFLNHDLHEGSEEITFQKEVDALLEGLSGSEKKKINR